MKKTVFIFAIVLISTLALNAQMRHISFHSNISSEKCKKAVENNLDRANGVSEYNADAVSKIITVKFDPTKTDPEKIKKVITEAGYKAETMKAKSGKKVNQCADETEQSSNKNKEKTENCCGK